MSLAYCGTSKKDRKTGREKMTTIITATVKGSIMEKIFEQSDRISIRHFSSNGIEEKYNPNKSYKYKITIRHPEGTDAEELLKNEIHNRTFTKLEGKKL